MTINLTKSYQAELAERVSLSTAQAIAKALRVIRPKLEKIGNSYTIWFRPVTQEQPTVMICVRLQEFRSGGAKLELTDIYINRTIVERGFFGRRIGREQTFDYKLEPPLDITAACLEIGRELVEEQQNSGEAAKRAQHTHALELLAKALSDLTPSPPPGSRNS